jgi:flagellar M-ring protein FliF
MNAPFARPDALPPIEDLPLWQQPEVRDYLRLGLGTLVVLVLVFGVLRPLLRNLAQPRVLEPVLETVDAGGGLPALTGETAQTAELLGPPMDPHEQRLAQARQAVQQDPRKVAQVVKNWVGSDA